MGDGTIDITDFVESLRATWVTVMVDTVYAMTLTIPWLSWLGFWGISIAYRAVLKAIFDYASFQTVQQVFFWNTAQRKDGQAMDFNDAVEKLNNLPATATDEEYEAAERRKISAFNALVSLRR